VSTELDKKRFLEVLDDHKRIIFKVENAYCKNVFLREDLIQEIVIQLWKSFAKYNDQYKYSTWIYRIALNVSISYYRKEKKNKKLQEFIVADDLEYSSNDMKECVDEDIEMLHRFIGKLNALNKALIILYLDDKNYKEIAGICGITETNVATKISRIKQKLKTEFSNIKT